MLKGINELPYEFDDLHCSSEITKTKFYKDMGARIEAVKDIESALRDDLNPEKVNTKDKQEVMSK